MLRLYHPMQDVHYVLKASLIQALHNQLIRVVYVIQENGQLLVDQVHVLMLVDQDTFAHQDLDHLVLQVNGQVLRLYQMINVHYVLKASLIQALHNQVIRVVPVQMVTGHLKVDRLHVRMLVEQDTIAQEVVNKVVV